MGFSGRWETISAPTTEKQITSTITAPSRSLKKPTSVLPFNKNSRRVHKARPTHTRHNDQASQATNFL
jgi:hypothetical protein